MTQKSSSFLIKHSFSLAFFWGILVVFVVVLGLRSYLGGAYIETSILKLLPLTEHDPIAEQAFSRISDRAGEQVIFSVSHSNVNEAVRGAKIVAEELRSGNIFDDVSTGAEFSKQDAFVDVISQHAPVLLTTELREALLSGQGVSFLTSRLKRALYSPLSAFYVKFLDKDPLLLAPFYLRSLENLIGERQVRDGVVIGKNSFGAVAMVTARVRGGAFAMQAQESSVAEIKRIEGIVQSKTPGTTLAWTGLLRFSSEAASKMRGELALIGNLSTWGVLFVVLLAFRSLRQLLTALVAISIGLLFGTVATICFFSPPHMLTLVFGASLLGVSVDYAMHFFAEHRRMQNTTLPVGVIQRVFAPITLGMITSLIGYAGLAITPFPGLRQMALFSIAGLIGTWGTVVFWFPLCFTKSSSSSNEGVLFRVSTIVLRVASSHFSRVTRLGVTTVLLCFGVVGVSRLHFNDDIRLLQDVPEHLVKNDRAVREPFGLFQDSVRFAVVYGDTEEEVLQRLSEVEGVLGRLVSENVLRSYQSLGKIIPAIARQKSDFALLVSTLEAQRSELEPALTALGISPAGISNYLETLQKSPPLLYPEALLRAEIDTSLKMLWIDNLSSKFASIILLGGGATGATGAAGASTARLKESLRNLPNVRLLDKVDEINLLIRRYRITAMRLVLGSYLVVGIILLWRYGVRKGVVTFFSPVLAALLTLACIGFSGAPANLFHLVALLLVLGMGVDYGIFLAECDPEQRSESETAVFSIFLCSLTTILAFGLLFISSYPILRSLGLVVSLGIAFSFVLSPYLCSSRR